MIAGLGAGKAGARRARAVDDVRGGGETIFTGMARVERLAWAITGAALACRGRHACMDARSSNRT